MRVDVEAEDDEKGYREVELETKSVVRMMKI